MPQADANAFKVLKRNHALLNRKSRDAFDIYKKNKRIKSRKIHIPELTKGQRAEVLKKVNLYKKNDRLNMVIWSVTSLGITYLLFMVLDFYFNLT